jgi:alpha,alpha-trehalose phosphorylase
VVLAPTGTVEGMGEALGRRSPSPARWRVSADNRVLMLKRPLFPLPDHVYPPDPWRLVEARFSERYCARAETIFAVANGFIGIRGTFEEGRPAVAPGTFVAGFHETWKILHAEEAFGLARTGQTIVIVPDATVVQLYVDDEPLFLPTARLSEYERVLDMRAGVLTRELTWATAGGKQVVVRSTRLVSLEHRHVAAIQYEVVLPEHSAPVVLSSEIVNRQAADSPEFPVQERSGDPRLATSLREGVLQEQCRVVDETRLLLGYQTAHSVMTLGVGVEHLVETALDRRVQVDARADGAKVVVSADASPGVPLRLTKLISYQSSRVAPAAELVERCGRTLDRVSAAGFGDLQRGQREQLDHFWDRADVRIEADEEPDRVQQAVRWNLFQVAQATWRADGSGVAAKGLTGHAYEGHYFWDTEIYVLPFLAYTHPRIARNLLRFRHSMLPKARERAKELNQRGALFAWRTINGEEASAYYQAGTAQYHINADIAYAVRRYAQVGGDEEFLLEVGAEMLIDTARLWADLGFYDQRGRFHIHGVTGPDEYTTVVNDNAYTNLMARMNLTFAAWYLRELQDERPAEYRALASETGLRQSEVEAWVRAAEAMHVPFDRRRGINPQDASFLEREVWDVEGTPPDRFPLLLHYHPLVIYRYQVIKQADIVLAMFLLGNEFDLERKRANFNYYDALTTGDSSLSACVQCVIAAEIGDEERALEYFRYALLMDLADVAGNVSDGVHIAAAAGSWMAIVNGFGGVRDYDGRLSLDPRLPRMWQSLEFSLRFRQRQLRIRLSHDEERYTLEEGQPLDVRVRDDRHVLMAGDPLILTPTGPSPAPSS